MDRITKSNYYQNSFRPSMKRNGISNNKNKANNKNIISKDGHLNLPYQAKNLYNITKNTKNFSNSNINNNNKNNILFINEEKEMIKK